MKMVAPVYAIGRVRSQRSATLQGGVALRSLPVDNALLKKLGGRASSPILILSIHCIKSYVANADTLHSIGAQQMKRSRSTFKETNILNLLRAL